MSDKIKEIYLSNLEWTKTHDNMGGVMGNVVFKDNMPYEEYNKLFKSGYFVLCDKDYITNLQQENQDYKSRVEKAVEYIKGQDMSYYGEVVETKMDIILTVLQGENNES